MAGSGIRAAAYGCKDQCGLVAASGIFVLALHVFDGPIAFPLGFEPVSRTPVLANKIDERVIRRRANAYAKEWGGFVCLLHAGQSLQIFGRSF
jgi:hypothetical protein